MGDAVYSRHVPKPTQAPAEPDPNPELPENQQKNLTQQMFKKIINFSRILFFQNLFGSMYF